jgi:hypothetical protein
MVAGLSIGEGISDADPTDGHRLQDELSVFDIAQYHFLAFHFAKDSRHNKKSRDYQKRTSSSGQAASAMAGSLRACGGREGTPITLA